LPNRRRQDWFRLFSRPRNKTDLRKSCLSDDLNDTVDYVLLNKIVVEEMEIRSHLLEHVAQRIITRVFSEIQKFPEYFRRIKNKPTYWW
jgi:dihydroneopterin aldolase